MFQKESEFITNCSLKNISHMLIEWGSYPRSGSSSEPLSATAITKDRTTKESSPDSPFRSRIHLFLRTSKMSLPRPEQQNNKIREIMLVVLIL
jgi:hypothetical protein